MSEKAIRFLSVRETVTTTTLSRTTIWREARAGRFPKPRKISAQRIAFVEAEVLEWCRARAAA